MTSYSPAAIGRIVTLLAALVTGNSIQGQTLTLASGAATKGSSLSLNLSLSGTVTAPAGLQWTIAYPANNITTLNATAGPVLTAAGKTLNCVAGSGALTCLATGMNSTALGNGVVAVVTATISSNTGSSAIAIPLTNVWGAMPDGSNVGIAGS